MKSLSLLAGGTVATYLEQCYNLTFAGCELTKDKPSLTWTFEEEDDDSDYLVHTLFLKHGVLGTSAVKAERNVVQIETKNFDKKEVKLPFLSLTLGQSDMVCIGPDKEILFA